MFCRVFGPNRHDLHRNGEEIHEHGSPDVMARLKEEHDRWIASVEKKLGERKR